MPFTPAPGSLFPEGSAAILFLTFFGFHHLVSGTESAGGAMLSSSSYVRAPCPWCWGSTNEATQCPVSRGQGHQLPAVLGLLPGTEVAVLPRARAWAWAAAVWGTCVHCITGIYTVSIWSLPYSLHTLLALSIVPADIQAGLILIFFSR